MRITTKLSYQSTTAAECEIITQILRMAGRPVVGESRAATLSLQLPLEHPGVAMFNDMVARYGAVDSRNWKWRGGPVPSTYRTYLLREWEDADFASAELVVVGAKQSWLGERKRDEPETMLMVHASTLSSRDVDSRALGFALYGLTIDEDVRAAWEAAGLTGQRWIPVEASRGDGSKQTPVAWPRKHKRHWGLFSVVQLPAVSPTMIREPYPMFDPVARPNMCRVRDSERFSDTQLHYRRADLGGVGPFDVAHALEGGDGFGFQYLIISKRAYELFKGMNLPLEYVPVVIEG